LPVPLEVTDVLKALSFMFDPKFPLFDAIFPLFKVIFPVLEFGLLDDIFGLRLDCVPIALLFNTYNRYWFLFNMIWKFSMLPSKFFLT
jgi:hypothetical protein